MSKPLIKICGIKSAELASKAIGMGAHFIGIMFHPSSLRFVDIDQAKKIARSTKLAGAIPVGVFVNHSAEEIKKICEVTEITYVQLHGKIPRQQHHLLAKNIHRIYVCTVNEAGEIAEDLDQGLMHCNPHRDYLLFDSIVPGTGKKFSWEKFHYQGNFPYILAGGLAPNNVNIAIQQVRPTIVDVSSGVEILPGEKNMDLINQFIRSIRRKKYAT